MNSELWPEVSGKRVTRRIKLRNNVRGCFIDEDLWKKVSEKQTFERQKQENETDRKDDKEGQTFQEARPSFGVSFVDHQ